MLFLSSTLLVTEQDSVQLKKASLPKHYLSVNQMNIILLGLDGINYESPGNAIIVFLLNHQFLCFNSCIRLYFHDVNASSEIVHV